MARKSTLICASAAPSTYLLKKAAIVESQPQMKLIASIAGAIERKERLVKVALNAARIGRLPSCMYSRRSRLPSSEIQNPAQATTASPAAVNDQPRKVPYLWERSLTMRGIPPSARRSPRTAPICRSIGTVALSFRSENISGKSAA